jgi:hypothetical protein
VWCIIANTPYGRIPGKYHGYTDESALYGYEGVEYQTYDFEIYVEE